MCVSVIIKVPGDIVDTSVSVSEVTTGTEWTVYIATKSGHVYRVTQSQIDAERPDQADVGNHGIFDELLKGDNSDQSLKLYATTEPVHEVSVHQAVLKVEDTVHSLAVSHHLMAIVTSTFTKYNVLLFPESLFDKDGEESSQHLPVSIKTFQRKSDNEERFLLYFITCNLINTDNCNSCDSLRISAQLFKSLFGAEAGLLNSPICIFCSPDGAVYYAPIKSIDKCQFQPQILCSLLCQVVGIQGLNLSLLRQQDEDGPDTTDGVNNDALLVCADNGRCMVITDGKDDGAHFVPMTIPGPVMDFCVHCNILFHTDGNSLYESTLVTSKNLQLGETQVTVSKLTTLTFRNIQNIVCLPKVNEVISERSDLLCQLYNGEIKILDPEICKSHPGKIQGNSKNTGQQIKNLLHGIENCNFESQKLNNLQEQQTKFMSQMSIASYLLSKYRNGEQSEFKSTFKITRSDSGIVENLNLSCHITNQSQVHLSHDWSAMVTIKQDDVNQTCDWLTHCVQLQNGLGQNDTVNLCVPLTSEHVFNSFIVCTSLILHFPKSFQNVGKIFQAALPVQICEEIIDILYFMQDESLLKTSGVKLTSPSEEVLKQLAERRPVKFCFEQTSSSPTNDLTESCSMEVSISTKLVESNLIQQYGYDETAILTYFLKDSYLLSAPTSKIVSMVTVTGHQVLLKIEPSSVDGGKMVLHIRCNNIGVCASIRTAILHRLKNLENRSTCNGSVSVKKMNSLSHAYQGFLKEFEEIHESMDHGNNVEVKENLLGLYKQIRQKDVLNDL